MIQGKLNQTAQWKRKTGNNDYAEPIYADPVDIAVRWEGRRRMVRNQQGKEVISECLVFCLEDVQPDDVITYKGTDYTVIAVSEIPNLAGSISHKEVAC
ncbi:MAG: hypothetical protein A4E53_01197 [Pelotomaculum sp. PtaB.Bin104]|nr:MAG: hypothetical protein A4E53_01197 [Pelotomaculum sp. PtaB.Bin104]